MGCASSNSILTTHPGTAAGSVCPRPREFPAELLSWFTMQNMEKNKYISLNLCCCLLLGRGAHTQHCKKHRSSWAEPGPGMAASVVPWIHIGTNTLPTCFLSHNPQGPLTQTSERTEELALGKY